MTSGGDLCDGKVPPRGRWLPHLPPYTPDQSRRAINMEQRRTSSSDWVCDHTTGGIPKDGGRKGAPMFRSHGGGGALSRDITCQSIRCARPQPARCADLAFPLKGSEKTDRRHTYLQTNSCGIGETGLRKKRMNSHKRKASIRLLRGAQGIMATTCSFEGVKIENIHPED